MRQEISRAASTRTGGFETSTVAGAVSEVVQPIRGDVNTWGVHIVVPVLMMSSSFKEDCSVMRWLIRFQLR